MVIKQYAAVVPLIFTVLGTPQSGRSVIEEKGEEEPVHSSRKYTGVN